MRWTTLGALLKTPEALSNSLEKRNQEKANEFAEYLTNVFNGNKALSRKHQKQILEDEKKRVCNEAAGVDFGSNWGSDGW